MTALLITFLVFANTLLANTHPAGEFVTQTVYGFLDFTTTIENTVMIFSPQSAPILEIKKEIKLPTTVIETKPIVKSHNEINPTKLASSSTNHKIITPINTKVAAAANRESQVKKQITNTSVIVVENHLSPPEYDLLSREPAEFIEETYRVHNFKHGEASTALTHNTHIVKPSKVRSNTRLVKVTDAPGTPSSNVDNQSPRNPQNRPFVKKSNVVSATKPSPSINSTESHRKIKKSRSRNKSKRRKNSYQNSKPITSSHQAPKSVVAETPARRSFRTKIRPSSTELPLESTLKLNRAPGRWQYKSPPKPRVIITKATTSAVASANYSPEAEKDSNLIINGIPNSSFSEDFESAANRENNNSTLQNEADFWETLNVDISTADNLDTYYEIATIKTPYIFQAGVVKKTRFVTITSTIQKVLPSTNVVLLNDSSSPENILLTPVERGPVESSIKTLDEIHLNSGETPSLETVTDILSTRTLKIKTQVVPLVYDNENITKFVTLLQSYDISTLMTVMKTILPLYPEKFNPSQNFKDFPGALDEAGSELNLEIDVSNDEHDNNDNNKHILVSPHNGSNPLSNDFQLSKISNYNNPSFPGSSGIDYLRKQETIWETQIIPLFNGESTIYQTFSKSIGVKDFPDKIEESIRFPPPPVSVPNPFIMPNPLNYHTITSSIAQRTVVTQTNSKVLKLTFGARTAYTTLFSTTVIPTEYTQIITTAVALPPTAAYPGYPYPPPYPFPYLG